MLNPDADCMEVEPYFCTNLMHYILCFQDMASGLGGGGMWFTALQLAGVNRNIIHTYKQVMGAFSSVVEDFTCYFFAFIVTHLLIWT